MRTLAALALVSMLGSPLPALAQNPGWVPPPAAQWEYGSPDELNGVRRIYVDTGPEITLRRIVIEQIRKEIPDMQIFPTPTDAQALVVLAIETDQVTTLVSTTTTTVDPNSGSSSSQTATGPATTTSVRYGGYVAKPLGQDRFRLLLDYDPDFKDRSAGRTAAATAAGAAAVFVPFGGLALMGRRRDREEVAFAKKFAKQFVKEWKRANPDYKKPRR
jgi:hypothetical protein